MARFQSQTKIVIVYIKIKGKHMENLKQFGGVLKAMMEKNKLCALFGCFVYAN